MSNASQSGWMRIGDDGAPEGVHAGRLAAVRERESSVLAERTRRSAEALRAARLHLPRGVPMGWMAGLYRHEPIVVAGGDGPRFRDIDGNTYLDFNLCDLVSPAGFSPEPVIRAVTEQIRRGAHFLLPTEDAPVVAGLLAERFGLPCWQFTLSAAQANVEALRIARVATGRERAIVFAGKYHGHVDDLLWTRGAHGMEPEALGLPADAGARLGEVEFNELDDLERELQRGDVAAVVTEPALTNCTLVLPEPGFHDELRRLTREHGVVLVIDVTHTQFAILSGGICQWGIEADIITGGKGIAGGVPIGCYGLSAALAAVVEAHAAVDPSYEPGLATGGTNFGNALSMAAARAAMEEVFTEEAHARVESLGARLADGIDEAIRRRGLPWQAFRLGGRSGVCTAARLPRTGSEGYELAVAGREFTDARKVYLANRGVWDAIATSGAAVSFAHEEGDIEVYAEALDGFLREVVE